MADETKPSEILLYEYFAEQILAAQPGDVLYELELHDTVYQKIQKSRGFRISDAHGSIAPGPGMDLREWDVAIRIVCYVEVEGKDKKMRQTALQDVFTLQLEAFRLLLTDQSWGDRICNSYVYQGTRGYDDLDGKPYAVVNIPILANPSGAGPQGQY